MKRVCYAIAVTALAITAIPSQAQAFCRGCVASPEAVAETVIAARASQANASAVCQVKKHRLQDGKRRQWRMVEVCE